VHAADLVGRARAVAVIGTGTLGLLTIAALQQHATVGTIIATAKYPEQKRFAKELGAGHVVAPGELGRAIRLATGAFVLGDRQLTDGVDLVVDCVGSSESIAQALEVVAPGGDIVLVGMPGHTTLDLTGLWHREASIGGSYAYTRADFTKAVDLVASADLGRLVSATYPLARYTEAIEHAATAGRRGAVKVAFDLRDERR
jgi:threonine dehydrogenase-like Zn-dependent dehydrogenase